MTTSVPVLEFNDIARSYKKGTPVIDGVTFAMAPGEVVALLGRNAAGKTTLVNLAMGMLFPHRVAFLLLVGMGMPRTRVFWNHQALASTLSAILLLGPLFFMMYLMFVVGAPQGAINCVIPLIERELLQLSVALPSNILSVLCVAAVPLLASYSLLEWQFRNSEMTGPTQVV